MEQKKQREKGNEKKTDSDWHFYCNRRKLSAMKRQKQAQMYIKIERHIKTH